MALRIGNGMAARRGNEKDGSDDGGVGALDRKHGATLETRERKRRIVYMPVYSRYTTVTMAA